MKIYNKKVFASGVFMVALGVLNLMADGINHTVDANGLILAARCYCLGLAQSCAAYLNKWPRRTSWSNWMSGIV